jgi:hypothetical protein
MCVAFLAASILFLATGIDDLANHIPAFGGFQTPYQEYIFLRSDPDNPVSDHCSACFFNLLLSQCVFPVTLKPVIAESFHPRTRLSRSATVSLAMGPKVNRGPPSAASFFGPVCSDCTYYCSANAV